MLSFIRRKLSESDTNNSSNNSGGNNSGATTVSGINKTNSKIIDLTRKASDMSLNNAAASTGVPLGEDALLKELGYKNATDLQETVYGKYLIMILGILL